MEPARLDEYEDNTPRQFRSLYDEALDYIAEHDDVDDIDEAIEAIIWRRSEPETEQ